MFTIKLEFVFAIFAIGFAILYFLKRDSEDLDY